VDDGTPVRTISRAQWSGLSAPGAVRAAVDTLTQLGWCKAELDEADTRGRPATVLRINPAARKTTIKDAHPTPVKFRSLWLEWQPTEPPEPDRPHLGTDSTAGNVDDAISGSNGGDDTEGILELQPIPQSAWNDGSLATGREGHQDGQDDSADEDPQSDRWADWIEQESQVARETEVLRSPETRVGFGNGSGGSFDLVVRNGELWFGPPNDDCYEGIEELGSEPP
jgi:hypothetical protein